MTRRNLFKAGCFGGMSLLWGLRAISAPPQAMKQPYPMYTLELLPISDGAWTTASEPKEFVWLLHPEQDPTNSIVVKALSSQVLHDWVDKIPSPAQINLYLSVSTNPGDLIQLPPVTQSQVDDFGRFCASRKIGFINAPRA